MTLSNLPPAFGVYVHWPFCQSKCPYCDFNAHLVPDVLDQSQWLDAYLTEIDTLAERVIQQPVTSIFFGGGTPSLMAPNTVANICDKLDQVFGLDSQVEISLEANPGSSDFAKFSDFASAGVNRISLGIQALDDEALSLLGRKHSKAEALKAIQAATDAVDRVSIDLIYARPFQTLKAWQHELDEAIGLGTEHLSLYQLTIEPGTRFEAMVRRGELTPLDEDSQAELFEETNAYLAKHGFAAYEVSNYARKGAECQHNLVYWRYQDYLGIGPGAHGRVRPSLTSRASTRNHRMPQAWLNGVTANGEALQEWQELEISDIFTETVLMGLRLQEPLAFNRLAMVSEPMSAKLKSVLKTSKSLLSFVEAGWLISDDASLVLTADGRMRLDAITATIINEVFETPSLRT